MPSTDEPAVPADLTPVELERLAALVADRSGLAFDGPRRQELARRAREQVRRAGFTSAGRWLAELFVSADRRGGLYAGLEAALQVRDSGFFRHPEHHRLLREVVLPALARRQASRVRIASVGCATGEEAYSVAMTVVESGVRLPALDLVAFDASRDALGVAVAGRYAAERLVPVPPPYVTRHFVENVDGSFTVAPALRRLIRFRHHDIRRGSYIGKFDVIFCSDVLADFTAVQRGEALARLTESLAEDGYLFLGHAEGAGAGGSPFGVLGLPGVPVYRRLGAGLTGTTRGPGAGSRPSVASGG